MFCQVTDENIHTEIMLSCLAPKNVQKKDWMTGEALYGPLSSGTTLRISHILAQRYLDPNNSMLQRMGELLSFELVIGVNGFVWLQGEGEEQTLCIQRLLAFGERLNNEEGELMAETLVKQLKK